MKCYFLKDKDLLTIAVNILCKEQQQL